MPRRRKPVARFFRSKKSMDNPNEPVQTEPVVEAPVQEPVTPAEPAAAVTEESVAPSEQPVPEATPEQPVQEEVTDETPSVPGVPEDEKKNETPDESTPAEDTAGTSEVPSDSLTAGLPHGEVDPSFNCTNCKGEGLINQDTVCNVCQGTGKV